MITQNSWFDALTGYDEAIEETGRTTDEKVMLGENEIVMLDQKFQILRAHIKERPAVTLTYFVPDLYKEGGSYKKEEVIVKRIDMSQRVLISDDNRRYDLDYIVCADSDLFIDIDL